MNGKTSYLNLFFQHEGGSIPRFLSEALTDQLPSLVFVYDVERRVILYGNQTFSAFAGMDSGALGELQGIVHHHDIQSVEALFRASAGLLQSQCTARLLGRNGQYHNFHLSRSFLQRNESGQAQLILFVAHDIAEVLKSKDEIETTRELLDETEELLQFGSWAWEIESNAVTWTSGLYSLLGYTSGEVAGRVDFDFYLSHVLDEYSDNLRETINNALDEKGDFSYEYVVRTKTGAHKNVSTRGKLVKDESGAVLKVLCINRDITALRSIEKEQERNIRELNRSNRDLEEFAYIASHDLQEPLRKISMFTERLKAKFDQGLDKEGELFIDRILASASNMRTLIDNLLDFSRANRRSHTFDVVDIRSVLERVISELELKIEETNANISFSGTFPTIEAVNSEMTQLFSNILSNAVKFRKDGVDAEIIVQAGKLTKSEKHVLGLQGNHTFHKIDVQDNGIGFEPEYSERIFQIFQRLNGKSEYPGSGIGLAICKKIVEKHNGLIFAKSQPHQGATFTIILPEKQF
jgi:PAS domain S-box-containing protein